MPWRRSCEFLCARFSAVESLLSSIGGEHRDPGRRKWLAHDARARALLVLLPHRTGVACLLVTEPGAGLGGDAVVCCGQAATGGVPAAGIRRCNARSLSRRAGRVCPPRSAAPVGDRDLDLPNMSG